MVWQAWMASPGNDTTPPPNTPKRVATSEAQVRQVLASAVKKDTVPIHVLCNKSERETVENELKALECTVKEIE